MRPLELSVVVKEDGEKEEEERFTLSLPDGTRHKQVLYLLRQRQGKEYIKARKKQKYSERSGRTGREER
jgi:hypothetical protein